MKLRLTLWGAGLAFLAAILLLLVFHARPGSAQPGAPPVSARVAAPSPAPQYHHPRIEAAIRHLEEAKHALEATPAEFHGHRLKAIEHVNRALEECHKALETGP
jgi:hypothetical protein